MSGFEDGFPYSQENDPLEIRRFTPVDRKLEFKVNRFMLKAGFSWVNYQGTNINGYWLKSGEKLTQLQAIQVYTGVKRWWRIWL